MKTKNLGGLYDMPAMEWSAVRATLDAGFTQAPGTGGPDRHTCWLSTINPDGGPHVTGVGALWAEGTFWFQCGPSTRKALNLARDPRCALSLAVHDFDLVVEGDASVVRDPEVVAARVADWVALGWPASVDATGTAVTAEFSAPSAGPPPWSVYRIEVRRATGVATVDPGGATHWEF
jgi:Pyridoxamine 5'-phosphate oxidase